MKKMKRKVITFLILIILNTCLALFGSVDLIYVVRVNTAIQPISAQYIIDNLEKAEQEGAVLYIIEQDTPGGLGESMRAIIQRMLKSNIPVVVYVTPSGARAASAGFFILMAADIAVMAPGTNTGAAHPIPLVDSGQEKDSELTKTMLKKLESDSTAFMKSIVEKRGRNVELALKAVSESSSFSAQEALKNNIIDYICKDREELIKTLNGKTIKLFNNKEVKIKLDNPRIKVVEMTKRLKFLSLLADPNITFILLGLAMLGIFFELSNPGLILPGIVGAICLVLFFFSVQILPINLAGIIFIIIAILMFILEAKVQSYGMLAAGGIISMFVGGLMLIDAPREELGVSLSVLIPATLVVAALTIFLLTLAIKAHRHKPTTGKEGLIGMVGVAKTDLNPEGKVFVFGELWDAYSDSFIKQGEKVIIEKIEGFKIFVKKPS